MLRIVLRLALGVALASAPSFAAIVQVGTCEKNLATYSTIGAAIASVPPGSTIMICPNSYPEQLVITEPLTLKGVAFENSGAVTITAPAGGIVANTTDVEDPTTAIAAQIAVNTNSKSTVNISGLVVDGSNNAIGGCAPLFVGIYYGNTSGTIAHVSAVNQMLGPSLNGCQSGLGILVDSDGKGGKSAVTLSSNYVSNFDKNGITGDGIGTTVTINGNYVAGVGPTSGAAENSIQVSDGAAGTVSGNIVGENVWAPDVFGDTGDAAAGILVYASNNIAVTGNTVTQTQYGIALVSADSTNTADGGTINSNKISNTLLYDGIDLCSNGSNLKGNVVVGSGESGIHFDDTCGATGNSNTVTGNTINTACAGILAGPSTGGNVATGNTFFNTVTQQLNNSDVCPVVAPSNAAMRTVRRHPVAFHP